MIKKDLWKILLSNYVANSYFTIRPDIHALNETPPWQDILKYVNWLKFPLKYNQSEKGLWGQVFSENIQGSKESFYFDTRVLIGKVLHFKDHPLF